MHHIDDLLATVINPLFCLFRRRIGANVKRITTDCNFSTVDLVNSVVLFDKIVRIGNDFVTRNNILKLRLRIYATNLAIGRRQVTIEQRWWAELKASSGAGLTL